LEIRPHRIVFDQVVKASAEQNEKIATVWLELVAKINPVPVQMWHRRHHQLRAWDTDSITHITKIPLAKAEVIKSVM
jgi:hypothetical protein